MRNRSIQLSPNLAFIVLAAITLAGCDSGAMEVDENPDVDSLASLSVDYRAELQNGVVSLFTREFGPSISVDVIQPALAGQLKGVTGYAGIWIAADQTEVKATVPLYSGYQMAWQEVDDTSGYFVVTPDSLKEEIANWPDEYGAPTDAVGTPRVFGDKMAWGVFRSDPEYPDTIENLRVATSVFIYDALPLAKFVFHRYDVFNVGESTKALHVGYGADLDVNAAGHALGPECEALNHHDNQVGYDRSRHLSYTYLSPEPGDGAVSERCYGDVYAVGILPRTQQNAVGQRKLAHPIYRRSAANTIYPEFSENHFTSPEALFNALTGLSHDGAPMINPNNGETTQFAFTGDPVAGTGWIDERHDGRNLISLEPISIAPGEHISMTAVLLFAEEDNLADGVAEIKARYDEILAQPHAWDF